MDDLCDLINDDAIHVCNNNDTSYEQLHINTGESVVFASLIVGSVEDRLIDLEERLIKESNLEELNLREKELSDLRSLRVNNYNNIPEFEKQVYEICNINK